ncbi:MAG TPA: amidohydrolase family protein, partial [Acetobacteraceae bacterium]
MHRASSIDLHSGIAHAMTTLIHASLPARYRRLTFQMVNLAGAFPMLVERMDPLVATRDPAAPRPSAMLDGIWVDNASLGPKALALGLAVFGADRVMLGTDYPIFATEIATAALEGSPARDRIGWKNAAGLLARYAS